MKNNLTQADYTAYEPGYQLKLPMKTEIFIPKDSPVRLLNAVVERMDLRNIMRSYSHMGRIEYPPRILLKILLYAYMRRIYSTREIERACRENVCFMYLLEGYSPPDHNTICRFRAKYLAGHEKDLLEQMTQLLVSWGFVSMASVFIDGTKIEANANRYGFVWRKSTEKARAKLLAKIVSELPAVVASAGIKWYIPESVEIRHLKKLRKKLCEKRDSENIVFVSGIGKCNLSDGEIFKVANSRLGLYRRSAGDVMNYTLSPKILGLKTKDRPGLVDPLTYYLARCT